MNEKSIAVWAFVVAAVLCAIAGLIPLFRGRSVNVTLLALTVVWLVVAIAVAARGTSPR